MTNPPPDPPHPGGHDPSRWARPNPLTPTERIPSQPPPAAAATDRITHQTPSEPATRQIPRPDSPTRQIPRPESPSAPPPTAKPQSYPPKAGKQGNLRRFVKDPLSVVLILVIVAALWLAALLGGELYGRSRANSVVAKVTECVVGDQATASFAVVPPFLWQHLRKHYTNISIETAGNQVLDAKGMKLNIDIKDVQLRDSADSAGTIGSLVATVDWTNDGIKQTVQDAIPLFGGIVSGVTTSALKGTIELEGPLGNVIARPTVTDGALALQVQSVTGLGFKLPRESVQPALDAFTSNLIQNLPMGMRADSVQVTDSGVTSRFSTQNSNIPPDNQDACFAGL